VSGLLSLGTLTKREVQRRHGDAGPKELTGILKVERLTEQQGRSSRRTAHLNRPPDTGQ
jgi:hypothetical protein